MVDKKANKNKKDAPANKEKKANGKSKNLCCKVFLTMTQVSIVILAALCYHVYGTLAAIPELPEIELDRNWGPNSTGEQNTAIRPFRIVFSDAMEEELRKRFDVYRAVTSRKKSITETSEYGLNSNVLAQLFAHWQFKYVLREREKYLNQFDSFKTNIQGLDIHFLHVKPKVDKNVKVYPLLLLHGWPSSVREFYDVIPLLTSQDPGRDFVFEVIAPSLPGFVFSQASSKPGLSPFHIAVIMRNLMHRLGFKKYFIQGGDFGHSIGSHMATIFPEEVLGFHTNLPANFSRLSLLTWLLGGLWPSWVGDLAPRMYPVKEKVEVILQEFGYLHLQSTKPDTIGIALTDSPLGLAAYILDRFLIFSDHSNKYLEDGGLSKYSMTGIIDNIMLYWTTSSMTTAMRLYKESVESAEEVTLASIPTPVPTWALRTKHELIQHPDALLKWKYPNLVGSTNLDIAGHFAAFERPKEFANDVFLAVERFLNQ